MFAIKISKKKNNRYFCSLSKDEVLRKKLKWRSIERGMAENEIVLGKYIDSYLPTMETEELNLFSEFLDEADPDMYKWFSGQDSFPEKYSLIATRVSDITNIKSPSFTSFKPVWEPFEETVTKGNKE
jgi:succinate dehydrogenase flavin-adding protein (antitoxin of CptAB toxin-antitoxin module)